MVTTSFLPMMLCCSLRDPLSVGLFCVYPSVGAPPRPVPLTVSTPPKAIRNADSEDRSRMKYPTTRSRIAHMPARIGASSNPARCNRNLSSRINNIGSAKVPESRTSTGKSTLPAAIQAVFTIPRFEQQRTSNVGQTTGLDSNPTSL